VKENSTGDYVESNIQRDGDYDYYRFDAEFVISGPHGHTVSVQIANGFIGMLPSVVLSRVGSLQGLGPARPATPTETETESVSDTESESDTDASTTHAAVDPSDLPHREPDTGRRVVRSTPPVPSAPVSGRYDRAVPPAFLDKPRPPSRKAVRGPTTGGRAAGVPRFDVDPDGIVYASSRRSAFGPDGRLLPPEERRCVQVAAVLRQPRPACS
jgi:hypothetical protein